MKKQTKKELILKNRSLKSNLVLSMNCRVRLVARNRQMTHQLKKCIKEIEKIYTKEYVCVPKLRLKKLVKCMKCCVENNTIMPIYDPITKKASVKKWK